MMQANTITLYCFPYSGGGLLSTEIGSLICQREYRYVPINCLVVKNDLTKSHSEISLVLWLTYMRFSCPLSSHPMLFLATAWGQL